MTNLALIADQWHNEGDQHQGRATRNTLANLGRKMRGEDWIAVTFQNGWTNTALGGGPYAPVSYMKDAQGWVHLRGAAAAGTVATIFTLPAGYCPEFPSISINNATGAVVHQIQIKPTGAVNDDTGLPTFLSLDGISFRSYA